MSTIAVLGGGGYIGSVLCRQLLNKGFGVKCVDNFFRGQCDSLIPLTTNSNFNFQFGDMSNEDDVKKAVENVDGIISLQGVVGFPACARSPEISTAFTIKSTELLLKHRDNKRPFLFASTGSVYGKIDGICNEDSPLNPQSIYGIHKKIAEDMVSNEPNTLSFRFATGFGVSPNIRVNLLINDLVYQAITNRCITVFESGARRTFLHVEDIASLFIFGITNKQNFTYKVYNAGAKSLNWTKRELAEYISKRTGCLVNYAETGKDLDQRDYEVDYSRLEQTGFKTRISIEEGIEQLIKAIPLIKIHHQYE